MTKLTMEGALNLIGLNHRKLDEVYKEIPKGPDYWKKIEEIYRDTIKKAHKETVKSLHPDINKEANATEICAQINSAVDDLLKLAPRPRVEFPTMQFINFSTTTSTTSTVFNVDNVFSFIFEVKIK